MSHTRAVIILGLALFLAALAWLNQDLLLNLAPLK